MRIIETRFLTWWRRHRHLTAGPAQRGELRGWDTI